MSTTTNKKPAKSIPGNEELKAALHGMGSMFLDLSNESKLGSEMIDDNITTEFAKMVGDAINNPVDATFQAYKSVSDAMSSMLGATVLSFLSKNKRLIKRVVKPFGENSLFYVIILKKDTTESRAKILSFLDKFEVTPFSNRFNIVFKFVPEQFENSVVSKHEVAL